MESRTRKQETEYDAIDLFSPDIRKIFNIKFYQLVDDKGRVKEVANIPKESKPGEMTKVVLTLKRGEHGEEMFKEFESAFQKTSKEYEKAKGILESIKKQMNPFLKFIDPEDNHFILKTKEFEKAIDSFYFILDKGCYKIQKKAKKDAFNDEEKRKNIIKAFNAMTDLTIESFETALKILEDLNNETKKNLPIIYDTTWEQEHGKTTKQTGLQLSGLIDRIKKATEYHLSKVVNTLYEKIRGVMPEIEDDKNLNEAKNLKDKPQSFALKSFLLKVGSLFKRIFNKGVTKFSKKVNQLQKAYDKFEKLVA